jgi:Predicted endonuclease distantly related to archaeal Holliday junction resolvase
MTKSEKRQFGDIGENVASTFLEKHGFEILERNYLRKWGEIDIVARKGSQLHFVEVKSVSIESKIRAEENMHPGKLKRLHRVIQTYLLDKKVDADWQLDLAVVKIDEKNRKATVEMIDNIV